MGGGWAAVPGACGAQDVGHLVSSESPASPQAPLPHCRDPCLYGKTQLTHRQAGLGSTEVSRAMRVSQRWWPLKYKI